MNHLRQLLLGTTMAFALGAAPGAALAQQQPAAGTEQQPGGSTACQPGDAACAGGQAGGTMTLEGQANDTMAPKTGEQAGETTRPKTEGQAGDTTQPKTDGQAGDTTQPKTDGQAGDTTQPKTDGQAQAPAAPSTETTAAVPNVEITTEQKTEIKQAITETKVEPVSVDFNVTIGTVVPTTVVVHELPPRIVKLVPAYKAYKYFILADGRIVIVEPSTLKIVVIIV